MPRRKLRLVVTQNARQDLREIAAYIRLHSPAAAARLVPNARTTFEMLRSFPRAGRVIELTQTTLWELRCVSIRGFPNHMAIYAVASSEIVVARVVHAARDIYRVGEQVIL